MSVTFSIPKKIDPRAYHVQLASWFGCGFLSPAPGTWGSLGGLVCGLLLVGVLGHWALFFGVFAVSFIGLWAAEKFDNDLGTHDSKMIVIDEVAGQWIAMIPAFGSPILYALCFVLFRAFDIIKPWPVSYFDKRVEGAAGVMGDDIVAGIMAAACILGLDLYVF
ncbi:MAG: phosphatidylglycerophosphatase A [Alphaproteobacteria bacterium]|nr:phosphatidylglycerophosphatase A [Alphaproteobacteria bacterium]